jgi:hypothetical protein
MKRVFRLSISPSIRLSIAVLIIAFANLSAAQAAPVASRAALFGPERPGFFAATWTWITLHVLPTVQPDRPAGIEKEGCEMDPNGHKLVCASAFKPVPEDAGCEMDPNGAR